MTLFWTFLTLAFTLAAFLTAISQFLQAYLYNLPASHLPVRGVIAGLLVSAYLTIWVQINTQSDGNDRYGTLLEFNPTESLPLNSFHAIRWARDGSEKKILIKKFGPRFVEADRPHVRFVLSTSDYLVSAIEIVNDNSTARFEAELYVADGTNPDRMRRIQDGDAVENMKYSSGKSVRVFREVGGPRYVEFSYAGDPSPIYAPSSQVLWTALALNFGHFVVWMIAFWPILRFGFGTALGLAGGAFLVMMILGMPMLFEWNKKKSRASAPVPASVVAPVVLPEANPEPQPN